MENLNNPVEEKIEEPIVESAPVVEEAPAVEVEPVVEEVAPVAVEPEAITTSDLSRSTAEVQAVGSVANGAIGVTTAPKSEPKPVKKAAAKKPAKEDTVAIHSTRNVTWEGVGKVYRGYNIVTKEAAEQWQTRSHIRIATPEEVAKEFGK
jgi:hypothetical protein